ncbi:MAG TPA: penicillin acylase family protein [Candidatus Dormibacteraeota bacterium]
MGALGRLMAAAGVAAGGVGALGFRRWFLRRPLPPRSERLALPGLEGAVEILFDRWGVPHVFAGSEKDAVFAQGYVHARDRLWQMELNRRLARGELAELLGSAAVPLDRFLRRLGLRRISEAELDGIGAERDLLDTYAAGVHAYVESHPLPVEFTLLRFRPQPWRPVDSLAFGHFMTFTQTWNWESELVRWRLASRHGAERAAEMEPGQVAAGVPVFSAGGSNNWVVAPGRSATGRALLANDPHLGPQVPGVWYAVHLDGGDYQVTGVSLPGIPGAVIGHNQRIAWGITSGIADTADLYLEEGGDGRVIREEIRVKGGPTLVEEVRMTAHGPLLNGTLGIPARPPLALKAVVLEEPAPTAALRKLARAGDWPEFLEALSGWTHPCLNFVYADVEGNIGYKLAGRVPVRSSGEGELPVTAAAGGEWTGYVPFEAMPETYNPPDGLFATANTRPAVPFDAFVTRDWIDDGRWRRIIERLAALPKHDLADLAAIQADTVSLPGREAMSRLTGIQVSGDGARRALELVAGWDGDMAAGSAAAAIYRTFRRQLIDRLHADLPPAEREYLHGRGLDPVLVTSSAFLFKGSSIFLGHLDRLAAEPELVADAFEAAVEELARAQGPDPTRWRWGRLHQVFWRHPVGTAAPLLDRLLRLSRGPFPAGGDEDTPNQTGCNVWNGFEATFALASYRQLFDVGDWDRSRFVLPPGQSGHPGSPHYADLLERWRNVEYAPLLWSRAAIEAAVEDRADLVPA